LNEALPAKALEAVEAERTLKTLAAERAVTERASEPVEVERALAEASKFAETEQASEPVEAERALQAAEIERALTVAEKNSSPIEEAQGVLGEAQAARIFLSLRRGNVFLRQKPPAVWRDLLLSRTKLQGQSFLRAK